VLTKIATGAFWIARGATGSEWAGRLRILCGVQLEMSQIDPNSSDLQQNTHSNDDTS